MSPVTRISASVSAWVATIDGTGRPPSPRWKPPRSLENPSAPPSIDVRHHRAHPRDLVVGRLALVGVVAHHVQADRRVADVATEVDRGAAPVHRGEVLGVGLEVPLDARFEGRDPHVLDLVERAAQ